MCEKCISALTKEDVRKEKAIARDEPVADFEGPDHGRWPQKVYDERR